MSLLFYKVSNNLKSNTNKYINYTNIQESFTYIDNMEIDYYNSIYSYYKNKSELILKHSVKENSIILTQLSEGFITSICSKVISFSRNIFGFIINFIKKIINWIIGLFSSDSSSSGGGGGGGSGGGSSSSSSDKKIDENAEREKDKKLEDKLDKDKKEEHKKEKEIDDIKKGNDNLKDKISELAEKEAALKDKVNEKEAKKQRQQEEAARRAEEAKRQQEEAARRAEEAKRQQEEAARRAEANRRSEEARIQQEEANRRAEEARIQQEEANRRAEEAKRQQEEANRNDEEDAKEYEKYYSTLVYIIDSITKDISNLFTDMKKAVNDENIELCDIIYNDVLDMKYKIAILFSGATNTENDSPYIKKITEKLSNDCLELRDLLNEIIKYYNDNKDLVLKYKDIYNKNEESLKIISKQIESYANYILETEKTINSIVESLEDNLDYNTAHGAFDIKNTIHNIYEKYYSIYNEFNSIRTILTKMQRLNKDQLTYIKQLIDDMSKYRKILLNFIDHKYEDIISNLTRIETTDTTIDFIFYTPYRLTSEFKYYFDPIINRFSRFLDDLEKFVLKDFKNGKGTIEDLLKENNISLNIQYIIYEYYKKPFTDLPFDISEHFLNFDRFELIASFLPYCADKRSELVNEYDPTYVKASLDEIIDFYNKIESHENGKTQINDVKYTFTELSKNSDAIVDRIKRLKEKYQLDDDFITNILNLYMIILNGAKKIFGVYISLLQKTTVGYYTQRKKIIEKFNLKEEKGTGKLSRN